MTGFEIQTGNIILYPSERAKTFYNNIENKQQNIAISNYLKSSHFSRVAVFKPVPVDYTSTKHSKRTNKKLFSWIKNMSKI